MSTGSTSASSSTLTSSSSGARVGQYYLPETFVDENGFQRPLNESHNTRRAGQTVSKTLIR